MCYSKCSPQKQPHFVLEFLIPLRGDKGQKLQFPRYIGLLVLKMFISKKELLLSWNFSNLTTLRGDMGQKLNFSRQHRGVSTQNASLKVVREEAGTKLSTKTTNIHHPKDQNIYEKEDAVNKNDAVIYDDRMSRSLVMTMRF